MIKVVDNKKKGNKENGEDLKKRKDVCSLCSIAVYLCTCI